MSLSFLQPPKRWEERLPDEKLLSVKLTNALNSSCIAITHIAADDSSLFTITNFQDWEGYHEQLQEHLAEVPLLALVAVPHPLHTHTQTLSARLKFTKSDPKGWFKNFPYMKVLYVIASTMGGLTLAFDIVALKGADCTLTLALSLPPEFIEIIQSSEITVIIDSQFTKEVFQSSDILPPNHLVGEDVFQQYAQSVFGKATKANSMTRQVMKECFNLDVLNLKACKSTKAKRVPVLETTAILEFERPLQAEHRALLRHFAVAQLAFILKLSLYSMSRPKSMIKETMSIRRYAHMLIEFCSSFQDMLDDEKATGNLPMDPADLELLYGDLDSPTDLGASSAKHEDPKDPVPSGSKQKPSGSDNDHKMDVSSPVDDSKSSKAPQSKIDPPPPPAGAVGGASKTEDPKIKLPFGGSVNIGKQNSLLCILEQLRESSCSPAITDRYIGELLKEFYLSDFDLKSMSRSRLTVTRWPLDKDSVEIAIEVRKVQPDDSPSKAPNKKRSPSMSSDKSAGSGKANKDFRSPPDKAKSTATSPVTPANPFIDRPAQFGCYGCGGNTHNKNKPDEEHGGFILTCPGMLKRQGEVLCHYPHCHANKTHFTEACQDMVRACAKCDLRGHWPNQCDKQKPSVWRTSWEKHADRNNLLQRRHHGKGSIEWGAFRFRSSEHLAAYKRLAPPLSYKAYADQSYAVLRHDYLHALFSLPDADDLIRPAEQDDLEAYRAKHKLFPPPLSVSERQSRSYARMADTSSSRHSSKSSRRHRTRSNSSRVASPDPTDTPETVAAFNRLNDLKAQMKAQLAKESATIKALRSANQQKLEAELAAKVEESQKQFRLLQERLASQQEDLDQVRQRAGRSPRKKKPK